MKPTGFSSSRATAPLVVSCDVGMQSIHVVCPALGASSFPRVYAIDNYTDPIRRELLHCATPFVPPGMVTFASCSSRPGCTTGSSCRSRASWAST